MFSVVCECVCFFLCLFVNIPGKNVYSYLRKTCRVNGKWLRNHALNCLPNLVRNQVTWPANVDVGLLRLQQFYHLPLFFL